MTYDFRHEAMHTVSKWAVLEQIVCAKNSGARRLDSQMVAAIYTGASENQWDEMSIAKRSFASAAVAAYNRRWPPKGCTVTPADATLQNPIATS